MATVVNGGQREEPLSTVGDNQNRQFFCNGMMCSSAGRRKGGYLILILYFTYFILFTCFFTGNNVFGNLKKLSHIHFHHFRHIRHNNIKRLYPSVNLLTIYTLYYQEIGQNGLKRNVKSVVFTTFNKLFCIYGCG